MYLCDTRDGPQQLLNSITTGQQRQRSIHGAEDVCMLVSELAKTADYHSVYWPRPLLGICKVSTDAGPSTRRGRSA